MKYGGESMGELLCALSCVALYNADQFSHSNTQSIGEPSMTIMFARVGPFVGSAKTKSQNSDFWGHFECPNHGQM